MLSIIFVKSLSNLSLTSNSEIDVYETVSVEGDIEEKLFTIKSRTYSKDQLLERYKEHSILNRGQALAFGIQLQPPGSVSDAEGNPINFVLPISEEEDKYILKTDKVDNFSEANIYLDEIWDSCEDEAQQLRFLDVIDSYFGFVLSLYRGRTDLAMVVAQKAYDAGDITVSDYSLINEALFGEPATPSS